jgi:4-amino-4-deoxy-L-arabinose transferase-like glycosyltransferase
LPGWLWALLLLLALQSVSLERGFWGAHGEARRAETAREVLQDGQWLAPTLLGRPFLTKPPLLYWLSALSLGLFGVHDWAARIPSLLATLGSWLAMAALGRHFARELALARGTPEPGVTDSGIALLAMPLVLLMGLNAETEALLLCATTCSVAAVLDLPVRGQPRRLRHWVLPGLALAAGFMVKGPLGWLFPAFGILAFETGLSAGRRRLTWGDGARLVLWQLVLVAPWFLAVWLRHPEVLDTWLGESVARLGDPGFSTHRESALYYLPRLAVFLPALLWFNPRRLRERVARIPWVWLLAGVLFLSLATSKRSHYLLSLAPAAALLVCDTGPGGRLARMRDQVIHGLGRALPFIGLALGAWLLGRGLVQPAPTGWVLMAGAGVLALVAWRWPLGRPLESWTLGLLLLMLAISPGPLAAVDHYRSPRAFYERCRPLLESPLPLLNWRNDGYAASFYLARPVNPVRTEAELDSLAPGGALLLCTADEASLLKRPSTLLLEHTLADPFRPTRTRTWQLRRVGGRPPFLETP